MAETAEREASIVDPNTVNFVEFIEPLFKVLDAYRHCITLFLDQT